MLGGGRAGGAGRVRFRAGGEAVSYVGTGIVVVLIVSVVEIEEDGHGFGGWWWRYGRYLDLRQGVWLLLWERWHF